MSLFALQKTLRNTLEPRRTHLNLSLVSPTDARVRLRPEKICKRLWFADQTVWMSLQQVDSLAHKLSGNSGAERSGKVREGPV